MADPTNRKRRPNRLTIERDAEQARLWRALMSQPGANRRIWNHVLDDDIKRGHESIESALTAYMGDSNG